MIQYSVRKLVFSSTCAVYAPAKYLPFDDKHPLGPESPYGETKLLVEKMIYWYGKLKGLNYVVLRYFNVCGASDDGLIRDSKNPSVLLVQNAVRGALGIGLFHLTASKVDTLDGTPICDYINVVDLNEAHLLALFYFKKGGQNEIINLGTGSGNSVLEVIEVVQKITGKKFKIEKSKSRKGEAAKMIADIKKVEKVLGWKPKRSVKDSVDSLVK